MFALWPPKFSCEPIGLALNDVALALGIEPVAVTLRWGSDVLLLEFGVGRLDGPSGFDGVDTSIVSLPVFLVYDEYIMGGATMSTTAL